MKVAASLAAVGVAAAVAPPTIELNLNGVSVTKHASSIYNQEKFRTTHYSALLGTATTASINEPDIRSRQDYSESCPAHPQSSEAPTDCHLPVAFAYDHVNKEVTVQKRLYLVDNDGTTVSPPTIVTNNVPDYTKRRTYLFSYDAHDDAGNHAEGVTFGLVLNDLEPPVITPCMPDHDVVEAATHAASYNFMCTGTNANDNIDGILTPNITYTVSHMTAESHGGLLNGDDGVGAKYDPDRQHAVGVVVANAVNNIDMKAAVSTLERGLYKITIAVHDEAGFYGVEGNNNLATKDVYVSVVDTTDPVITITGGGAQTNGAQPPLEHECGTIYNDMSATVTDTYEDAVENTIVLDVANAVQEGNTSTSNCIGVYDVVYSATDTSGNDATPKTRIVQVVDTTAPIITLVGGDMELYAGRAWAEPGWRTYDSCWRGSNKDDTCPSSTSRQGVPQHNVTMSWGGRPLAACFDTVVGCMTDDDLGTYVRTYTLTDCSGNTAVETRTFTVVDDTAPIIELVGDEITYVNASHTEHYTDLGAKCEDYVGGEMNNNIKVTGNIVKREVLGVYIIQFDCEDENGNHATPKTRQVIVRDITCPVVTIEGLNVVYTEAGFPYVDAGATATDDYDGDVSHSVTTNGDQVDVQSAFYARRSCKEIKTECQQYQNATRSAARVCSDGDYYITTYVSGSYERELVWCDMATGETYKEITGVGAVVPYGSDAGSCPQHGLVMPNSSSISPGAKTHFAALFVDNTAGSTNKYLCASDSNTEEAISNDQISNAQINNKISEIGHDKISAAEPGKYIITYHAVDYSGNTECTPDRRTVIVKDTLPPVIVVHLTKKNENGILETNRIGQGNSNGEANGVGGLRAPSDQVAWAAKYGQGNMREIRSSAVVGTFGGEENPALKASGGNSYLVGGTNNWDGNPFAESSLMAEQTAPSSSNAWIIGAAVSGITGLALLASSTKSTVVVTVPV